MGFLDSSLVKIVGKESACNVGDPGSIPGSGQSGGEEIGYPLQYSWDSLVAQPFPSSEDLPTQGSKPGLP